MKFPSHFSYLAKMLSAECLMQWTLILRFSCAELFTEVYIYLWDFLWDRWLPGRIASD